MEEQNLDSPLSQSLSDFIMLLVLRLNLKALEAQYLAYSEKKEAI